MTATTKIAKERRRKHGDWFWVKKKLIAILKR